MVFSRKITQIFFWFGLCSSKDTFPVIYFIKLVFVSHLLPLQNNMPWDSIRSLAKSLHGLTCDNAFTDVPEACLPISLVFCKTNSADNHN